MNTEIRELQSCVSLSEQKQKDVQEIFYAVNYKTLLYIQVVNKNI